MVFFRLLLTVTGIIWLLSGCESTHLSRYNYYMNVKDYNAAREIMQEEVRRNPFNPEAHLMLGKVHLELREYEKARTAFHDTRLTTSEYIDHTSFLLEKYYRIEMKAAVKAMKNAKYTESVTCLLKAADIKPDSHEIYPALGYSYLKLGEVEKAYESYLKATQLNEQDAESWHVLAELAFRKSDMDQAYDHARRAVTIDDRYHPAREILFYIGLEQGRYEMAEQAYLAIPEPKRPVTLSRNYALSVYNQGRFETALPCLENIAQSNKDDKDIIRALAETYYHLNEYRKMTETYETLWSDHPDDPDVLMKMISAYDLIGSHNQAEQFRDRLHELYSDR